MEDSEKERGRGEKNTVDVCSFLGITVSVSGGDASRRLLTTERRRGPFSLVWSSFGCSNKHVERDRAGRGGLGWRRKSGDEASRDGARQVLYCILYRRAVAVAGAERGGRL